MLTPAPQPLTTSVSANTSFRCVPATKRLENFIPSADFSAKLRSPLLSESAMKADLNMWPPGNSQM